MSVKRENEGSAGRDDHRIGGAISLHHEPPALPLLPCPPRRNGSVPPAACAGLEPLAWVEGTGREWDALTGGVGLTAGAKGADLTFAFLTFGLGYTSAGE